MAKMIDKYGRRILPSNRRKQIEEGMRKAMEDPYGPTPSGLTYEEFRKRLEDGTFLESLSRENSQKPTEEK